MCRWFAYISGTEKCLLEDVLILPDHSISKQVDDRYLPELWPRETSIINAHGDDSQLSDAQRTVIALNFNNNSDGLGIAWYSNTRNKFTDPKNIIPLPTLYKSLANPTSDANFTSICATVSTKALFAHIRAASPGMHVSVANCHPFTFGRFSFMHNGEIGDFQAIKKLFIPRISDAAYAKVAGTTDSEHLAGMFFTILSELSVAAGGPSGMDVWMSLHPISRYVEAFNLLLKITFNTQAKAHNKAYSSLNMCMTDGEQLVAVRFRSHPTQDPPSLYWTDTAGVSLNRKYEGTPNHPHETKSASSRPDQETFSTHTAHYSTSSLEEATYGTTGRNADEHGDHLIVASEPSTKGNAADWHMIPKNTFILKGGNKPVEFKPVGIDWQKEMEFM